MKAGYLKITFDDFRNIFGDCLCFDAIEIILMSIFQKKNYKKQLVFHMAFKQSFIVDERFFIEYFLKMNDFYMLAIIQVQNLMCR